MQEFSTDKKIIVPCEKDDTDTGLAIQKAIETGADEILMIGGTGTRLDKCYGQFRTVVLRTQQRCEGRTC